MSDECNIFYDTWNCKPKQHSTKFTRAILKSTMYESVNEFIIWFYIWYQYLKYSACEWFLKICWNLKYVNTSTKYDEHGLKRDVYCHIIYFLIIHFCFSLFLLVVLEKKCFVLKPLFVADIFCVLYKYINFKNWYINHIFLI